MRQLILRGSLTILTTLAGCVGSGGFTPAHLQTDPARVLSAQRGTVSEVRALRAEARIDQRGEQGRIRGTVFMFAERPASVRVDAMSQFGPVSILTSDGATFSLSDFRDKRFLTGPACAENVARLLRIPMRPEQMVDFLLGGGAEIAADQRTMRWDADAGHYVVTLVAADGHRQVLHLALRRADRDAALDAQRFDLTHSALTAPSGQVLWQVDFEEHGDVQADGRTLRWPYKVRIRQPQADLDTRIRFKRITLNPTIPPGAFAQQPAGGMRIEEAPCD